MRRLWSFLLATSACTPVDQPADAPGDAPPDSTPAAVTWHEDVRPIFEAQCLGCHTTGGPAPFAMDDAPATWSEPPSWAAPAAASVAAGTMPPWRPDPTCRPLQGARRLTDAEKGLVAAWADAGFPAGDPASYADEEAVVPGAHGPADVALRMPEPFVPDVATPDDYRCFVLDYDASVERWMSGFFVQPDRAEMVHHVILYQLDEDWADDVAAWDAADERPGYACLFDAGTWESAFFAGWAPGQGEVHFEEGVARRVPVGSKLILQLHYNTQNLGGEPPPADQSGIDLWFLEEDAAPTLELVSIPFPITDLNLPAGAPEVVVEETIELGWLLGGLPESLVDAFAGVIKTVGVFPHMHELGTEIRLDLLKPDGTEDCLFAVDDWDFAWQQSYFFESDARYVPDPDDALRLRCTYDNSAANQPVFNGVQQEPRDVSWGEGTTDEMCLMFFDSLLPVGLF
jgi:hypothetical protein